MDYSTARPSPSGLMAAGKRFVARYVGPGSSGKHLSASEARALRSAGLSIVSNAEGSKAGYKGTDAGRSWASLADDDLRGIDSLASAKPIYFSVDWDAGPSDWASIDAALRGSASVIGANRVGVYGSYDVIAHCVAAGTAKWFWQTYAWSNGKLHPKAHIYQYHNGVNVAGGDCDLDRALVTDYGQWGQQEENQMSVWDEDVIPVQNHTATWVAGGTLGATYDASAGALAQSRSNGSMLSAVQSTLSTQGSKLDALTVKVDAILAALPGPATVDVAALAADLAPLINGMDQAEVEAALRAVLRTGTDGAPV